MSSEPILCSITLYLSGCYDVLLSTCEMSSSELLGAVLECTHTVFTTEIFFALIEYLLQGQVVIYRQ